MFFSNTILGTSGMPASTATLLVGVVNMLSTVGGMALLSKFGRKTLMVYGTGFIVLFLLATGIF